MHMQNRQNSCKFNGYCPLQNSKELVSLKTVIAYFADTNRYAQAKKHHLID